MTLIRQIARLLLVLLQGHRTLERDLGRCSRWGCLLPVGKSSCWGRGPLCEVCRYGVRPISLPRPSEEA